MEKTRAQLRLEKLLRTQEALKQKTARAKVQHRQQRKAQLSRHTTQLGQLMRAHGFEDVPVEQVERWLKRALSTTPFTVLDETADLPGVEPQSERHERQPMPTPKRQAGGSESAHPSMSPSPPGGIGTEPL
jgi:hypothetical protein